MATKYLSVSANLSAAVWLDAPAGSVTTAPTTGDDADLNTFTLTVDQNFTCDNIVGAGALAFSGSRTINANCGSDTSAWTCTLPGSQTQTINGAIRGGTGTKFTVNVANSILNVTGDVFGGVSGTARGIVAGVSTATVNVIGNLTGGSGSGNNAALVHSSGTVTVTGNVTGGSGASPAPGLAQSNGTCTITGNVFGAAADGVSISTGTLTINGDVTGGTSASARGLVLTSGASTVVVNGGTVTGGSATSAYGILHNGSVGALTITANLVDGTRASALVKAMSGAGSVTYTPTNAQTAIIGGKTMYPTRGGSGLINAGLIG